MTTRAAVVAEAMTWLGTPHHHRARVKGDGVDCGQLPAAVFEACGLIPHCDPGEYPHDWHLHQDEERYLEHVERFCDRLPDGMQPLPGDLILFRYGRCISHGALVVEWPLIIHACVGQGVILEYVSQSPELQERMVGAWRLRAWAEVAA